MGKKVVDIFDKIIYRIIGIVVIFLLAKCICELLWYTCDWKSLLEWVVVIYLIFSIITWHKYIFIGTLSLSGVALLIFSLKEYFFGDLSYYIDIIKETFNYYYAIIANNLGIPIDEQILIIFLFIILLSILYHVLAIKYKAYYIISILGLVLYGITNYFGTLERVHYFAIFLICQVFLFFINKIKQNNKSGYFTLFITASIFASLLVISGFAFSELYSDPISVIDEIKPFDLFKKRVSPDSRNVWFIDKERLSGTRNHRNTIVLEVISDSDVYLRGSVCDYFDAITWSNTINTIPRSLLTFPDDTTINQELLTNFNRQLFGVGLIDQYNGSMVDLMKSEDFRKFFSDNEVSVSYKNLASDVVFLPLNAYDIAIDDLDYNVTNGDVVFYDTKVEEEFTYSFKYLKPQVGNQLVEETITNIAEHSSLEESGNLTDEELQAYLQLPESITDRTKDLAHQLTKDVDTTYEKAKSIEGYLKNNYLYRLDVTMPENDVDLVDYFLFDNRKGYCSYYASAMVVLLRSEGIPSRLVKGFRASKPKEHLGERPLDVEYTNSNTIYVREKDAHAWVEVYIDGFGWLAFEPTSGFNIFNNQINIIPEYEQVLDETVEEEIPETTDIVENKTSSGFRYSIVIFALIILVLIIILYIISLHLWRKKQYMLKSNKDKITSLDSRITRIINIMSTRRKEEETLKIYYQGMYKESRLATIDWNKYYKIVERVYYSNGEISIEEVTNCENTYKTLRRLLKEYNKFKYYIYS